MYGGLHFSCTVRYVGTVENIFCTSTLSFQIVYSVLNEMREHLVNVSVQGEERNPSHSYTVVLSSIGWTVCFVSRVGCRRSSLQGTSGQQSSREGNALGLRGGTSVAGQPVSYASVTGSSQCIRPTRGPNDATFIRQHEF